MSLSDADIARAARTLDVEEAAIRAVIDVESRGRGFLETGEPVILYEPHVFSRLTDGRFDDSHPDLSYPSWRPGGYGPGGLAQYRKLERAAELDRIAAHWACSWGLFQIMGFNHAACGYSDVFGMVEDMRRGERQHLEAFVRFLKHLKHDRYLRVRDWEGFARAYNGPGYAIHDYDLKLKRAYKRHAESPAHNGNYGESKTGRARVTADSGLRLREQPNTSAPVILTMPRGTEVEIVERLTGGEWALVLLDGRRIGYAATRYLA